MASAPPARTMNDGNSVQEDRFNGKSGPRFAPRYISLLSFLLFAGQIFLRSDYKIPWTSLRSNKNLFALPSTGKLFAKRGF